ncbi:MAG: OsmC family peroxiredoxin [Candidatus Binatia bacterium]
MESFPASDPPAWVAGREPEPVTRGRPQSPTAKASAEWRGALREGAGALAVGSGALTTPFTYESRFRGGLHASNPEELIGAAHAGCFSMFLAAQLAAAGFPPAHIRTQATVHLGAGPAIVRIELDTAAEVPGIDQGQFADAVDTSKRDCPVSKALAGVPEILVTARLISRT